MENNNTITQIQSAFTEEIVDDAYYAIDFSKLTSVNDLMIILACMGFTFHTSHPKFDTVKPFLATDSPIRIPSQPSEPREVPFKLPKLKK